MHHHRETRRFLFENRAVLQRVFKLPRHIISWIEAHEDTLQLMYDAITQISHKQDPGVFEYADFISFCACVARLSKIDTIHLPTGLLGGRSLVHDFGWTDNQIDLVNRCIPVSDDETSEEENEEHGDDIV